MKGNGKRRGPGESGNARRGTGTGPRMTKGRTGPMGRGQTAETAAGTVNVVVKAWGSVPGRGPGRWRVQPYRCHEGSVLVPKGAHAWLETADCPKDAWGEQLRTPRRYSYVLSISVRKLGSRLPTFLLALAVQLSKVVGAGRLKVSRVGVPSRPFVLRVGAEGCCAGAEAFEGCFFR